MRIKNKKILSKNKGHKKRKIIYILVSIILIIYSISLLTPLYYMINNSLKTPIDYYEKNPWIITKTFYFNNYKDAVNLSTTSGTNYLIMFLNSIIFTTTATAINVLCATFAAYTLAKYNFWGKKLLTTIAVGAIVIPDLGSTSTIYKLFLDLNIMDTWFTLIRYTSPFGMGFLIIFGAFSSLSNSYSEAAKIDGASDIKLFFIINLPIIKGTIGCIAIIVSINCWNDYLSPYMYMNSIKMLSVGLQEMASIITQFKRPCLFAGMILAIIPLIVIFISMHNVIIMNTVAGGLKE